MIAFFRKGTAIAPYRCRRQWISRSITRAAEPYLCGTQAPLEVGVSAVSNLQFRAYPLKGPRTEAGVALLAFLLVLLVGGSYALLNDAKSLAQRAKLEASRKTSEAMAEAKVALIARAIADENQPGSLPCPDISDLPPNVSNDGIADLLIGPQCPNYTGRIPWRTLRLPDLFDESGERPWYALSASLRDDNSAQPINSDTAGLLYIDGTPDIVAMVFAPGPGFNSQNRPSNNVADYLESANADDDTTFVTHAAGDFNDHVLVITRQELMAVVEKRVLGETEHALVAYRAVYGSFPWPAPFQNPDIADYGGVAGTAAGQLPIHITGKQFPAPFAANWSIPTGGTTPATGARPPTRSCVRNSTCLDPIYGPQTGPITGGTCTWTSGLQPRIVLECRASRNLGPVTRTYEFRYQSPTWSLDCAANSNIACSANPSATATRTRNFFLGGALPFPTRQIGAIRVTDNDNATGVVLGERHLNIPASSTGSLQVTGIPYGLDSTIYATPQKGPELPPWFVPNEWHFLMYAACPNDSTAEKPPGAAATACTVGSETDPCLMLNGTGAPNNNKRAIIVSAGSDLTDTPRTDQLQRYFEGDNAILDNTFERQPISDSFNDQVQVIDPRTTP